MEDEHHRSETTHALGHSLGEIQPRAKPPGVLP